MYGWYSDLHNRIQYSMILHTKPWLQMASYGVHIRNLLQKVDHVFLHILSTRGPFYMDK